MSLLNVKLKDHKEWRKLAKKLRRKKIRQKLAKELELEENKRLNDPVYQKNVSENEAAELIKRHTEELLHQDAEENWIRNELLAQKKFREEQRTKELEKLKKEENHLRIQQELRNQRQILRDRLEELKNQEEERIEKRNLLLAHIKDFVDGKLFSLPEELTESANTNPGKSSCKFFSKTAACRFGDKCISNHSRPGISNIVLVRNFYHHVLLEQANHKEYRNSDMSLEYSDYDLYEDYNNFYNDVVPEIEEIGEIENFRVCCNYDLHLRGNVYIQFKNQRDAMKAYLNLQGRYYAKRQLNVEFCSIPSWKVAVCGLSFSKRCSKGRYCNFLHLFKNPGNKYNKPLSYDNLESERISTETSTLLSWKDVEKGNKREDWRWSDDESSIHTSTTRKRQYHERESRSSHSLDLSIRQEKIKKRKTHSEKKSNLEGKDNMKVKNKKRKKSKTRRKDKKKKTDERTPVKPKSKKSKKSKE